MWSAPDCSALCSFENSRRDQTLTAQLRIRILTALNLSYDEWHNFLGNRAMVDALLSRLRHFCHTVKVEGPPLREPQG